MITTSALMGSLFKVLGVRKSRRTTDDAKVGGREPIYHVRTCDRVYKKFNSVYALRM